MFDSVLRNTPKIRNIKRVFELDVHRMVFKKNVLTKQYE